MSRAPSIGIPELAGLGNYSEAARIGFSVDDTVARLLRYQWLERAVMRTAVSHLTATPEWEVKCALGLLQWQCAEHVEGLRQRVAEMRHPLPALEQAPDPAIDRFCEELLRARDTAELIAGVYEVAVRAVVAEYRDYLRRANVLVDHPTRRVIRFALAELEEALWWAEDALAAMTAGSADVVARVAAWRAHLVLFLAAAGGVSGMEAAPVGTLPRARGDTPFVPDFTPRRDDRFQGQRNFEFPPHVIYNDPSAPADERNLALLCKRALEMDVPEMMASVMVERTDLPWEFHRDYARQLWDEMRHAMMGTVALEARGIDWTRIPLNVGFALRLNLHASAEERQAMLFAIEQSLMPGETGKRFEYRTAVEAGDALSAQFQDFDWADEVLHAQIGRRWLRRCGVDPEDASARAPAIHERTWAALDQYKNEPQRDWWDEFVRLALGRPSAVPAERRSGLKILAE